MIGGMNIFWFRRDLRLEDNQALAVALDAGDVLPIFIFDSTILDALEDRDDRRVSFIYDRVTLIKRQVEQAGGTLQVFHGRPDEIFRRLLTAHDVNVVYAGNDYEPYARERDMQIAALLAQHGAGLQLVKDHVIHEPHEVLKADGKPYTVYTPYMRAWKKRYLAGPPAACASEDKLDGLIRQPPAGMPSLAEIGFDYVPNAVPEPVLDPDLIRHYHACRDFPALSATSLTGPHLRFGTLSARRLADMALDLDEVWLNQLIWREFFIQILFHFPYSATASFRREYDTIRWRNNREEFTRWCEGRTGFTIVDAGMRQLNETGYMHNRVRMITANFLTRLLLIDWRWGERWFARKLLDYELANNVGGWQWCAGSGCDAAPYFRIFNPDAQTERFDPQLDYVRRWVPEFGTPDYPLPMVDYRMARERALVVYKAGLQFARAG